MTAETVLVTGAFGLVGSETVRQLMVDGRHVVATDLDIPANRKAAQKLPPGVDVRYADLTDPASVDASGPRSVAPAAIIHLAAIIPPFIYMRKALAEKVNVGATASLVSRQPQRQPARRGGSRRPASRPTAPATRTASATCCTADTPLRARRRLRGAQGGGGEALRASGLDWVMLRLGGVLTVEPRFNLDLDTLYFEGVAADRRSPPDRRRARRRARLRRGDHRAGDRRDPADRRRRHRIGWSRAISPRDCGRDGPRRRTPGRSRGDPDNDADWFNTDWMDTARSAEALRSPACFVATATRRDRRANGLAPPPGTAGRSAGPCSAPTPLAVFPLPRPLRRPVGRHRCQMD